MKAEMFFKVSVSCCKSRDFFSHACYSIINPLKIRGNLAPRAPSVKEEIAIGCHCCQSINVLGIKEKDMSP